MSLTRKKPVPSVFVMPIVQKLQSLDLSSRRIDVGIKGAVSKQGIRAELQRLAAEMGAGTAPPENRPITL